MPRASFPFFVDEQTLELPKVVQMVTFLGAAAFPPSAVAILPLPV